mmetsp:Transcript_2107/g.2581  ORF Transcript_2107/g.2581 Transcript_2107/m.2581 type:complete len:242 (-) Transcript_2107:416-1141(-)
MSIPPGVFTVPTPFTQPIHSTAAWSTQRRSTASRMYSASNDSRNAGSSMSRTGRSLRLHSFTYMKRLSVTACWSISRDSAVAIASMMNERASEREMRSRSLLRNASKASHDNILRNASRCDTSPSRAASSATRHRSEYWARARSRMSASGIDMPTLARRAPSIAANTAPDSARADSRLSRSLTRLESSSALNPGDTWPASSSSNSGSEPSSFGNRLRSSRTASSRLATSSSCRGSSSVRPK